MGRELEYSKSTLHETAYCNAYVSISFLIAFVERRIAQGFYLDKHFCLLDQEVKTMNVSRLMRSSANPFQTAPYF